MAYILNNLNKQIIHFGQPPKFNDPNEFLLKFHINLWIDYFQLNEINKNKLLNELDKNGNFYEAIKIFSKSVQKSLKYKKEKLSNLLYVIAQKHTDRYGIFCLAPSPYNTYFWKNYCNNYNGICCEYDLNSIHPCNHNFMQKVNYGQRVIYKPEYLNPTNIKDINMFCKNYPSIVCKLNKESKESFEAIRLLMITKSIDWEVELENRLISCLIDFDDKILHDADLHAIPRKIYIGHKVANEIKTYLIDFCDNHEIKWEIVNYEQCVDFSQYQDYIHSKICKIE